MARHVPRCCLAWVSFSPFSGAEVKKMTAEQARCCQCLVFLCSRCIWHGAQQLAHIGQCYLLLHKILTLLFLFALNRLFFFFFTLQDPAGIFELVEVVGNGTYGQVYKVGWTRSAWPVLFLLWILGLINDFSLFIHPGNRGNSTLMLCLSLWLPLGII